MNKPLVIIADDDTDLSSILSSRCEQIGLEVRSFPDATAALVNINTLRPDVVLLDVEMPAGNGLSVCEMMAFNEKLKSTPVIIMTGKSDEETVRRCHALRAFYVAKCTNIWNRIEPLLRELLNLGVAGNDPEETIVKFPTGAAEVDEQEDVQEEAQEAVQEAEQDEDIMDVIFAAFDCNNAFLDSEPDTTLPEERERKKSPWVLCIDDDSEFSFALQLRLQEHGVEVIRAFAGREGYRNAVLSEVSAIILDYEMPEGNGDYVLRRLKESPITSSIPVIVLTGRRDKHLQRTMYGLGADCFMTKPYDWPMLWGELKRFLPATEHCS
jgi:DNA-binding response OmpR family regulator